MSKQYTIKPYKDVKLLQEDGTIAGIVVSGGNDMQVSDGFHNMDELYDHRIELFITLARTVRQISDYCFVISGISINVWRSKKHSDGSEYEGWFILGIHRDKGLQKTYHLPISRWSDTDFADTLDMAPEYDGHTSADVLNRLKKL